MADHSLSKTISNFLSQHSLQISFIVFMVSYHFLYRRYFGNDPPKETQKGPSTEPPEDCPGMESSSAGKASQCEGCPNQSKCSSGEGKLESEKLLGKVIENLRDVKNIILVMSGKGGVGKSTIATQLSYGLESEGFKVGLLDLDITGPSIPGMTNTQDSEVFESSYGWTPVYIENSLSVISIGHLLKNPKSSIVWRGAKKDSLIRQFLVGVNWGSLDFLVVDCPPGSSDEHISICNYLKEKSPKAIMVSTPQKRCLDDVYRSCLFCKTANLEMIALVENMTSSVFDFDDSNNSDSICEEFKIANILKVPLSRQITVAGEEGKPLVGFPALESLVECVKSSCATP